MGWGVLILLIVFPTWYCPWVLSCRCVCRLRVVVYCRRRPLGSKENGSICVVLWCSVYVSMCTVLFAVQCENHRDCLCHCRRITYHIITAQQKTETTPISLGTRRLHTTWCYVTSILSTLLPATCLSLDRLQVFCCVFPLSDCASCSFFTVPYYVVLCLFGFRSFRSYSHLLFPLSSTLSSALIHVWLPVTISVL